MGGTGVKVDKLEDSMVSGSLNDRDDDDNAASGYNHLVIPNQQDKKQRPLSSVEPSKKQ